MQSLRMVAGGWKKIRANARVIWLPFLLKWSLAALILSSESLSTAAESVWHTAGLLIARTDLVAVSGWLSTRELIAWVRIAAPCILAWLLDAAILVALATLVLQNRLTSFFRDGIPFAGRIIRAYLIQLILIAFVIALFNLAAEGPEGLREFPWKILLVIYLFDLWGDYLRGLIIADRLTSVPLAALSALRFVVRNSKPVAIIGSLKAVQLLLLVWVALFMDTHYSKLLEPVIIWLYTIARAWHYAALLVLLDSRPKKVKLFFP